MKNLNRFKIAGRLLTIAVLIAGLVNIANGVADFDKNPKLLGIGVLICIAAIFINTFTAVVADIAERMK